jgi:hypothetical protein
MALNIFTTKRVSCFGQYDRIDDLTTGKLRGDKRPVFRQFLVDEFHFSAVFKRFDPLFVWHFRIFSGEISVSSSSPYAPKTAWQCFHRRNNAHTTMYAARRGSGCDYSLVFSRLPRTIRASAWFTSSFRADLAMRGFAISFSTSASVALPDSFLA